MMPWLIDFHQQKVVIIGGGQVAYRKALAFYNEGANITIIALKINPLFDEIICQKIQKEYDSDDLTEAFFVFAATDNLVLNQQIISDAKQQKIMCASATKSDASLHSMAAVHTRYMTLGVSTNGQYPALTKRLKQDLLIYDDYLAILVKLREIILDNSLVVIEQRQKFFRDLLLFEIRELQFIYRFVKQRQGILLIFPHHVGEEAKQFAKACQGYPISYQDKSYQTKIDTLQLLQIKWVIQPMTVSKGIIYQRIQRSFSLPVSLPLIANEMILYKFYLNNQKRLFMIHPSKDQTLYHMLKEFGDVCYFGEVPPLNCEYDQIIPFVLQKGYHYQQDIQSVRELLKGHYHQFDSVLLENPEFQHMLIQQITNTQIILI